MKKRILFLFLISVFKIVNAQLPSYVPTSGLMGWWPFGGNASDYSGNNYTATINGATQSSDRFGYANCAYSFNGTSDYIATNYTGILGTNERAVSFWAKTTNSVSPMAAVSWGDSQFYPNTGKKFGCEFNYATDGLTIDGADCAITYASPAPFADNQWHHYVYQMHTGDLLNQIEIYMDGVLASTVKSVYNPTSSMSTIHYFNVFFGKMDYVQPYMFQGSLDDIAIWARTLTNAEITAMLNGNSSCNLNVIKENNIENNLCSIYPNPSSKEIYLKMDNQFIHSINNNVAISIYSYEGRLIKQQLLVKSELQNNNKINIENLAKGFYILRIESDNYIQNIKFVKN